jgi:hypothetical protein
LDGQPRAIVFHEKDGRRHAHCVWSRIDAETMTARRLSHWKVKLGDVSRALHHEFGIELPRGLAKKAERSLFNFSHAEWQAAKRRGEDPRTIKETVQECWATSDGRATFAGALKERGYFLAQGDRRSFIVVDLHGDAHALARLLDRKTKEVNERLGKPGDLPSVEATQKGIGQRMTPALRAHLHKAREAAKAEIAALKSETLSMRDQHRIDRAELAQRQSLEWDNATIERAARMPRGIRAVWSWITGKTHEIKARNQCEAIPARFTPLITGASTPPKPRPKRRPSKVRLKRQCNANSRCSKGCVCNPCPSARTGCASFNEKSTAGAGPIAPSLGRPSIFIEARRGAGP